MRSARVLLSGAGAVAAVGLVFALPVQASRTLVPRISAGVIGLPPPMVATGASRPALAPVAGQEFEITFPVVNASTGARLTNVTSLTFAPTIGGRSARLQEFAFVAGFRAVAGAAWMKMKVPVSTLGELLKVKVTITVAGRQATRIETFRVVAPPL